MKNYKINSNKQKKNQDKKDQSRAFKINQIPKEVALQYFSVPLDPLRDSFAREL